MKKPFALEARDQAAHAGVGGVITIALIVLFNCLPILCPLVVGIIALFREWWQHKEIYLPTGGSAADIVFFVIGSIVSLEVYLYLISTGVISWI